MKYRNTETSRILFQRLKRSIEEADSVESQNEEIFWTCKDALDASVTLIVWNKNHHNKFA